MGASSQTRESRLRLLDGLRFVAAFAVVIFHYTARTNPAWGQSVETVFPGLTPVSSFGYLGVWLFFLISGFVVIMSVEGKTLRSFVVSRITRLYPAYWCAVLLTATLLYFTQFETPAGAWNWVGPGGTLLNLTMFQAAWNVPAVDGVYWSLWVELVFYGLVAGLFIIGGPSRRRMLALAVGWPIAAQLTALIGFQPISSLLGPMFAPFFGIGIILYLMYRGGFRFSYCTALALDLGFGLFEGMNVVPGWIHGGTPTAPAALPTAAVMVLLVAVVAVVTLTSLRSVSWRWLSVLGALTYPLYLLHEIIGWWIISQLRQFMPPWLTLILTISIVLGLAAAVHYWVERPLARALRRWAARDVAYLEDDQVSIRRAQDRDDSGRTARPEVQLLPLDQTVRLPRSTPRTVLRSPELVNASSESSRG